MFSAGKFTEKQRAGIIYLLIGLVLIILYGGWKYHNRRILSFEGDIPQVQISAFPKPVKIEIEKVGLNLDIKESAIVNKTWQVSEKNASHLNTSANPGERGNIVIYGHNRNNLFGPIRWLEEGNSIRVTNEKGEEFLYQVVETVQVKPKELKYVLPKERETLTLYTCNGLMDSKRYIVIAEPVD